MRVERIPIDKVNPAAYNPRKDLQPGDAEYEKLKRSLHRFDLVEPLVWNQRTGNLVGGHQRLKILKERGDTEVEVSVVDLDTDEEKALNIALNKIEGEWDEELLAEVLKDLQSGGVELAVTGFDPDEIDELLGDALDEDEEDFDVGAALAELGEPRCKPGEVWQLGEHRLVCGDSTKQGTWQQLFGDAKADLIVTSPPYNVDMPYESYKDKQEKDDYLELIAAVGEHAFRYLAPGRFVAWNVGVSPESYPHYHVVTLEGCGFSFYRQIIWEKSGVPWPLFASSRRVKKARHYRPNYKHEAVYLFESTGDAEPPMIECPVCDGKGETTGHVAPESHDMLVLLTNGKPELGDAIHPTKRYAHDVWRIAQSQATVDLPTIGTKAEGLKKKGKASHMQKAHPAAFPVELPKAVMGFLTGEGEVVCDPFAGAGATLIACEQEGRTFYGIELDPTYCELSMQRWERLTGKKAVRVDGTQIEAHTGAH